jgi:hypothetical protein
MNLTVHHVPGTTDTYYIPDFVTEEEEAYLLRKVSPTVVLDTKINSPPPQIQETPQPKWKQLSNRRYIFTCFMNPALVIIPFPRCSINDGSCYAGCKHGVTRKFSIIKLYLRSDVLWLRW